MKKFLAGILAVVGSYNLAIAQVDADDVVKAIPNPLETSAVIKSSGAEYKKSLMNASDAADRYSTNYKKAVNLGVFSADLGMANLYSKTQDALNYLTSIQKLADGLSIGKYFDSKLISDLLKKNENMDDLLQVTNTNLEKITGSLAERNQQYLSMLLVTGGWVEATYFMTQLQKEKPNAKLKEKIAEQVIVLDQLIKGLEPHKSQQGIDKLLTDLKALRKTFDAVKQNTVKGEPVMKVNAAGELEMVGGDVTTYSIPDAALATVTSTIATMRAEMVK